jgi:hypothetical protein
MHSITQKDKSQVETVFLVPTGKETIDQAQKTKLTERVAMSQEKLEKLEKKMTLLDLVEAGEKEFFTPSFFFLARRKADGLSRGYGADRGQQKTILCYSVTCFIFPCA